MTERDILISMLMKTVLAYFDDDTTDDVMQLLEHYENMSSKELILELLDELKLNSVSIDTLIEYVRKCF